MHIGEKIKSLVSIYAYLWFGFWPTILSTVVLMLQCCVCRLSVQNVLWLNGAS